MCFLVNGVQTCALPIFALDLIWRIVRRGAVAVALVIEIGCVDLADRARNVPGLRIPADMIADLEIVAHGTSFRTDQHVCSARVPHACQPRVERFPRSEEHTSELQSLMRISYAVFCLKKKKKRHKQNSL